MTFANNRQRKQRLLIIPQEKGLFAGHALFVWRHIKGQYSLFYYPSITAGPIAAATCLPLHHNKLKICLVSTCVRVRIVSTHAGRRWQVHYFDCRLTICLYDRLPRSLAIEEKHIDLSPGDLRRLSNPAPVHRWTCWVLLDRIGYWLRGS